MTKRAVYVVPVLSIALIALAVLMTRAPRIAGPGKQPALLLLCDAGLRPPIEEIVEAFQRRSGAGVEVYYAAGNLLLGRLKLTGQGDVFLSGDALYVEEAGRLGLVAGSEAVAWSVPVIQVARGNPKNIQAVEDLAAPGVRLALAGERSSDVGRITPEIFRLNGVSLDDVQRNTALIAVTSTELGRAVSVGHADAAVVRRAVALQYPLTEVVEISAERNVISPVEAVVLTASEQPDHARSLLRFLAGPAAREILKKYHYTVKKDGA